MCKRVVHFWIVKDTDMIIIGIFFLLFHPKQGNKPLRFKNLLSVTDYKEKLLQVEYPLYKIPKSENLKIWKFF